VKERLVMVEWHDSYSDDNYIEKGDYVEPYHVMNVVGYFVQEDEESIVVAREWIPKQNRYRDYMVVLKINIQEIIECTMSRKEKSGVSFAQGILFQEREGRRSGISKLICGLSNGKQYSSIFSFEDYRTT